ncbi:MAG: hypothetical protein AAFO85_18010 [Cyanobacteria bacterium J06598_4]
MASINLAPTRKAIAELWLKQEYPIYPVLGLVSTIIATLAAIFIIPTNTTTPQMPTPQIGAADSCRVASFQRR